MVKEQTHRTLFKCLRCNWQWLSKMAEPNVCPKCHSPYWDKERILNKTTQSKED